MLLGYNTNGLAHHDLLDAIELLAAIGYNSVAITIDHHALSPRDPRWLEQLDEVAAALRKHGMRSVIETGARYLLNPVQKHEPTLVSPDAEARIEFLQHAIDVAAALGSDCVSLWSGVLHDDSPDDVAWDRLSQGLTVVLAHADDRNVPLGFEPEPGMFVDGMSRYAELLDRVSAPRLQLTLDVGHLQCLGETPITDQIRHWADRIVNVHFEDMRSGEHEHLMFGEGEIDFPPVIAALQEIGYVGGLHVELSRHSHVGPYAAMASAKFLRPLVDAAGEDRTE